jgi:hypothetical protein
MISGVTENGSFNNSVTVTLNATDNTGGSGVNETFYMVNGGPTTTYSAPFVVDTLGPDNATYWSTDKAGNVEPQNIVNFTISPTGANVYNVSGFKLNSSDNSGIKDWLINISNSTMSLQDVTDSNGSYMFSGLSNGTYTITEGSMTGWTNVSPKSIGVTINGLDLPNQNFTNMPTTQPPVNLEVAYIVIVPYAVSLHDGDELQFHAQAYNENDKKIDASISYAIEDIESDVGTISSDGLFSALNSGDVRVTASNGDISDTAIVTVTSIDKPQRHGNRHHNRGGWHKDIGTVN